MRYGKEEGEVSWPGKDEPPVSKRLIIQNLNWHETGLV